MKVVPGGGAGPGLAPWRRPVGRRLTRWQDVQARRYRPCREDADATVTALPGGGRRGGTRPRGGGRRVSRRSCPADATAMDRGGGGCGGAEPGGTWASAAGPVEVAVMDARWVGGGGGRGRARSTD